MQHTSTHCNTLQHADEGGASRRVHATHWNSLEPTAAQCNPLQLTAIGEGVTRSRADATQCNLLQHSVTHTNTLHHTGIDEDGARRRVDTTHSTSYNTLQHTATHCNTLMKVQRGEILTHILMLSSGIVGRMLGVLGVRTIAGLDQNWSRIRCTSRTSMSCRSAVQAVLTPRGETMVAWPKTGMKPRPGFAQYLRRKEEHRPMHSTRCISVSV